jgi:hypothetical protein
LQAFGGVGYAFKWGDVVGGWRYLDDDFKSGRRLEDANLNGPMPGVALHWQRGGGGFGGGFRRRRRQGYHRGVDPFLSRHRPRAHCRVA